MYYGTHGPFKRAEGGQAITFENDKVWIQIQIQAINPIWKWEGSKLFLRPCENY